MNLFLKKRLALLSFTLIIITFFSSIITMFIQKQPFPLREEEKKSRVSGFLKKELNLTENQYSEFDQLQREYFHEIQFIRNSIRKNKTELYRALYRTSTNNETIDRLSEEIGNKHAEMETTTLNFFLDLKKICTGKQRKKLDKLFIQILRKIEPRHDPSHKKNNKRPPPPGSGPRGRD